MPNVFSWDGRRRTRANAASKMVAMARYTLVYGLRLIPEGSLQGLDDATLTLADGTKTGLTLHTFDGTIPQLRRSLDRSLDDAVPALLWVLDALAAGDAFLGLDPPQRRRRAIESVKALLLRESRVQPLILVFEDLHWVDAETQAVLDSLVEGLPTAPVLLAVNYRPEYRHRWGSKTYYRQLRVDPLPPASMDVLLDALLGHDPSVTLLKTRLIARTEGNPLYLIEFFTSLGKIAGAAAPGENWVPPSLRQMIQARIDALDERRKAVLQACSVIGRRFALGLVQVFDQIRDDLLSRLYSLKSAEYLQDDPRAGELVFYFQQNLTREVSYGSLLDRRRREFHLLLAEHLAVGDPAVAVPQVLCMRDVADFVDFGSDNTEVHWRSSLVNGLCVIYRSRLSGISGGSPCTSRWPGYSTSLRAASDRVVTAGYIPAPPSRRRKRDYSTRPHSARYRAVLQADRSTR